MAGGLSTCIRGEKPQQKRHPFLPLLYHIIRRVSTRFVTRFFICCQHYLYREEEIKAKPPSIAKWLAARTLIRRKKPYQKRHPFLPLLYHTIRRMSTQFGTRFLCRLCRLYRERCKPLPTHLSLFRRFIVSCVSKYSRASALSCSTCARNSSNPANLRSGRRNSINLTRIKRP